MYIYAISSLCNCHAFFCHIFFSPAFAVSQSAVQVHVRVGWQPLAYVPLEAVASSASDNCEVKMTARRQLELNLQLVIAAGSGAKEQEGGGKRKEGSGRCFNWSGTAAFECCSLHATGLILPQRVSVCLCQCRLPTQLSHVAAAAHNKQRHERVLMPSVRRKRGGEGKWRLSLFLH